MSARRQKVGGTFSLLHFAGHQQLGPTSECAYSGSLPVPPAVGCRRGPHTSAARRLGGLEQRPAALASPVVGARRGASGSPVCPRAPVRAPCFASSFLTAQHPSAQAWRSGAADGQAEEGGGGWGSHRRRRLRRRHGRWGAARQAAEECRACTRGLHRHSHHHSCRERDGPGQAQAAAPRCVVQRAPCVLSVTCCQQAGRPLQHP